MPELPEVEVTRRGIEPYLMGQRIAGITVRNPNLRWPIPGHLERTLVGLEVHQVARRAKYLLLDCGKGTLILHLGMSGSLRILSAGIPPQKHDHFDLELESGTVLRLTDPRRFGAILWTSDDILQHPLLAQLGPEPLTLGFDGGVLYARTRGRGSSIKEVLMNSHVVVGIGNIYASEALFHAGINPKTNAGRIGMGRSESLAQAIKETLKLAIKAGGSSLRDYVNSDGKAGYFQQQYWVYDRTGHSCRKCGAIIRQIKQGQRSSFYCPHCQK